MDVKIVVPHGTDISKICTQRIAEDENGIEEIHLECRFSDGQKFAAVIVSSDFPKLANRIERFLNNKA